MSTLTSWCQRIDIPPEVPDKTTIFYDYDVVSDYCIVSDYDVVSCTSRCLGIYGWNPNSPSTNPAKLFMQGLREWFADNVASTSIVKVVLVDISTDAVTAMCNELNAATARRPGGGSTRVSSSPQSIEQYQWSWKDDSGWVLYDPDQNNQIERSYHERTINPAVQKVEIFGDKAGVMSASKHKPAGALAAKYEVHFQRMVQLNTTSGFERAVKRKKAAHLPRIVLSVGAGGGSAASSPPTSAGAGKVKIDFVAHASLDGGGSSGSGGGGARASGGGGGARASGGTVAAPLADWSCASCTYVNAASDKQCVICMNQKPISTEITAAASAPLPAVEWACAHCTFVNVKHSLACAMCYKSKPSTTLAPAASGGSRSAVSGGGGGGAAGAASRGDGGGSSSGDNITFATFDRPAAAAIVCYAFDAKTARTAVASMEKWVRDSWVTSSEPIRAVGNDVPFATVAIPTAMRVAAKNKCTVVEADEANRTFKLRGLGKRQLAAAGTAVEHAIIAEALTFKDNQNKPPTTWVANQSKPVDVYAVVQGSTEWLDVEANFNTHGFAATIVKVERVQNKYVWGEYARQRSVIAGMCASGDANELLTMKHGTQSTDPTLVYSSDVGIDYRYCQAGMYGKGAYFAEDPDYTHNGYTFDAGGGNSAMFLCRILAGNVDERTSDSSIKHPAVGHHSVRGAVRGNQYAYILYEHYRSYPEYLVTYKK